MKKILLSFFLFLSSQALSVKNFLEIEINNKSSCFIFPKSLTFTKGDIETQTSYTDRFGKILENKLFLVYESASFPRISAKDVDIDYVQEVSSLKGRPECLRYLEDNFHRIQKGEEDCLFFSIVDKVELKESTLKLGWFLFMQPKNTANEEKCYAYACTSKFYENEAIVDFDLQQGPFSEIFRGRDRLDKKTFYKFTLNFYDKIPPLPSNPEYKETDE